MGTTNSNNVRSLTDLTYLKNYFDNDELVIEKVNVFIRQTPRFLMQMNKALKNNDLEMVEYTAHKVKPSFQTVGMNKAADLAFSIEQNVQKQISSEEIKPQYIELNELYNQGKVELITKIAELLTK